MHLLKGDEGLNYCFWVLLRIAAAARAPDFDARLTQLGIDCSSVSSALDFVRRVSDAVQPGLERRRGNAVFSRFAELSLRRALSQSITDASQTLFGTSMAEIHAACHRCSSRDGFGKIARRFFTEFTRRTVRFVIDKEISNHVGSQGSFASSSDIGCFYQALDTYCEEASLIVEDFSGGWFSKHNWETNDIIPEDSASSFTAYALEKFMMELREDRK